MTKAEAISRMEELFSNSEDRVMMAQQVLKCAAASLAGPFNFRKGGHMKDRILCLTAKRRGRTQNFRGMFHVCKPSGGGKFTVRQSLPVTQLTKVVVGPSASGEGHDSLDLIFSSSTFSGDVRVTHETLSSEDSITIVRSLYVFCRRHENRQLAIKGIDSDEVALWTVGEQNNVDDDELEESGPGRTPLQKDSRGGPGLVSAKEAKDLQSLLEMFSLGFSDVKQFQDRLNDQLASLEAANVRGILGSAAGVATVEGSLQHTEELVEDMEEALAILDVKLRHMRTDIAAIEARNNNLELQTRNNSNLLTALDRILESLELSGETERVLHLPACDLRSVPAIADAGWELHQRLMDLQPAAAAAGGTEASQSQHRARQRPKLSPAVADMVAVQQQRDRLKSLTRAFADRVASFLQQQFGAIADSTIATLQSYTGGSLPEHDDIRSLADDLSPLVQVLQSLQPTMVSSLQLQYCEAVNGLLRRELRAVTAVLRKAAAAGDSSAGGPNRIVATTNYSGSGRGTPLQIFKEFLGVAVPLVISEATAAAEFLELFDSQQQQQHTLVPRASGALQSEDFRQRLPPSIESTPKAAFDSVSDGGGGGSDTVGARPKEPEAPVRQTLGPQGLRAVEVLVEGISSEFATQVGVNVGKSTPHTVAMAGAVIVWRARVAGHPCGAALESILQSALASMLVAFDKALWDKVAVVKRFVLTSMASAHVVPGFKDCVEFLKAVEDAITTAALELPDDLEALPLSDGQAAGASVTRLLLGNAVPPLGALALQSAAKDSEAGTAGAAYISAEELPDSMPSADTIKSARDVADPAYSVLISNTFAALERLAVTDAKHADRLRLENYSHFVAETRDLSRRIPVVTFFHSAATEAKEASLLVYIQQQLDYAKMWRLLEFSQRMDHLLEEVGPGEVPFQLHYQASDLKALLATCTAAPDKKVTIMRDRVRKHLAHDASLCAEVWRSLEQVVLERYDRLGEQMERCYEGITLKPTPTQLRSIFLSVTAP